MSLEKSRLAEMLAEANSLQEQGTGQNRAVRMAPLVAGAACVLSWSLLAIGKLDRGGSGVLGCSPAAPGAGGGLGGLCTPDGPWSGAGQEAGARWQGAWPAGWYLSPPQWHSKLTANGVLRTAGSRRSTAAVQ